MSQETNNKPLKKLRSGLCSAAIWDNTVEKDGKTMTAFNVTFQRSYQDPQSGEWKNSTSFTPYSLGNLLALCLQAMMFCSKEEDQEENIPI